MTVWLAAGVRELTATPYLEARCLSSDPLTEKTDGGLAEKFKGYRYQSSLPCNNRANQTAQRNTFVSYCPAPAEQCLTQDEYKSSDEAAKQILGFNWKEGSLCG